MIVKKPLLMSCNIVLASWMAFAHAADSTSVVTPNITPAAVQGYVLAAGILDRVGSPFPNLSTFRAYVNEGCPCRFNTKPYVTMSIKGLGQWTNFKSVAAADLHATDVVWVTESGVNCSSTGVGYYVIQYYANITYYSQAYGNESGNAIQSNWTLYCIPPWAATPAPCSGSNPYCQ